MLRKIILLLLVVIISASCSENNIQYEYYESGKIKEEIININKQNGDYIYVKYFESGVVLDSFYSVNDKVHGWRKQGYSGDSVLFVMKEFKNGKKTGNVKILNEFNILLGKGFQDEQENLRGEWVYFFSDGKTPKIYKYFDKSGSLAYFQLMDFNGRIKSFKGEAIIDVWVFTERVVNQKSYEGAVEIIHPPGVDIDIKIGELETDSAMSFYRHIEDAREIAYFEVLYELPGSYCKVFAWAIKNQSTGEVIQGRRNLQIEVFEN